MFWMQRFLLAVTLFPRSAGESRLLAHRRLWRQGPNADVSEPNCGWTFCRPNLQGDVPLLAKTTLPGSFTPARRHATLSVPFY